MYETILLSRFLFFFFFNHHLRFVDFVPFAFMILL